MLTATGLVPRDPARYSKAALANMTRCMALELAPHGVRVNANAAGTVITDWNREFYSKPENRGPREASGSVPGTVT